MLLVFLKKELFASAAVSLAESEIISVLLQKAYVFYETNSPSLLLHYQHHMNSQQDIIAGTEMQINVSLFCVQSMFFHA